MKWIKCTNQQPPKDRAFLGFVFMGYDSKNKDIRCCFYDCFRKKFIEDCSCSGYEHDREYIEVIYWMELPERPED